MKQTAFLVYTAAVFLFSLFYSITQDFSLQWFVSIVVALLFFYYLFRTKKAGVSRLPGLTIIITPLFLTSLLILAGVWFVLGEKNTVPVVLVFISVVLWFIYDLTQPKSGSK